LLFPASISPDGRWLLAGILGANTECHCYLADTADPGAPLRAVTGHLPGSFFYPGPWAADSSGFHLLAAPDGDRVSLAFCPLDNPSLIPVATPEWDVEWAAASGDGSTLAWIVNEDGRSVVRVKRRDSPVILPAVPDGVVRTFALSRDGSLLCMLLDSPTRPAEVAAVRLDPDSKVRYLTDTGPPELQAAPPVTSETVSYPADGDPAIPALVYRPSADGKCPVVLSIHGGPDLQARPDYDALHQCLLAHGIAVFAPNAHGSAGYGHAWQTSIYRDWGGIDLRDFGAALTYLRSLDWVDPDMIGVYGASYGGFAALSCLARLPGPWAVGVSICGPSNLETLDRSAPPDWRAAAADMVGDPDHDADGMRARSPLTYAAQITAPLFIVQGAQDPRVPKAESDQIVARLRAKGIEIRYDVYEDEGHEFTNRDNEIRSMSDVADFLISHLRAR
jgi:dipeptidyl aminopeptidase/acylaminoacyl peptidase